MNFNGPTPSQNDEDMLTIFIGSLPGEITHREILSYFVRFHPSIKVFLKFKTNGICAGYGVAKLQDQQAYNQICQTKHLFNGRLIECRPYYSSKTFGKYQQEFQGCRVYVTKIPMSMTNQQLTALFESVGPIIKAYR
jgi:RNA recognition motif-containing protein